MNNCEKYFAKCKAYCCGFVPIPVKIWDKYPRARKVIEQKEINKDVFAHTETGYCPYLKEDLTCSIYENRPDVCRQYGDESHLFLTCAWQDKNGRVRNRPERRRLQAEMEKRMETDLKLYKQIYNLT